jgi:aminoglycoside phosphotransferase family enzyme/predicted kinase
VAGLPPFIEALTSPVAYPHPAGDIRLIQTHISYVLLAGQFAYKIKKPLNLRFLDYSTIEKRRFMCEEEVRLNRRLCAEAYVGVVPIVRRGGATYVGGDGDVIDYAVKMRRMPDGRMMPALLRQAGVTFDDIRAVARTVAAFHRDSLTDAGIARFGRVDAVRRNWDENFEQIAPYAGRLVEQAALDELRQYVEEFLRKNAGLMDGRADRGCVRDCHGDLRADAIVIHEDGSICVMDCIEFNDRIRFGDVASDIGFLAMDLEFRGYGEFSDELIGAYLRASNDETLPLMLNFYKCYRAAVRGKVDAMRGDEPEVPQADRVQARAQASAYFSLALSYARAAYPQVALLMIGLSGSGKSYIANAVAGRIGAVVVSSDLVRKRSAGVDPRQPMSARYGEGMYGLAERARVYNAMHALAGEHLAAGRSVIVDATYLRRADRDAAAVMARDAGVPMIAIEVTAADSAVRERLGQRAARPDTPSDAGWEIHLAQRHDFEPPDEIAPEHRIQIDGGATLAASISKIVEAIAQA